MSSLGSIVNNLISGELIAYPTEGVWGLGCDPNNLDAVQMLLNLKERSPDKGLILLGSSFDHFIQYSYAADYREELMSKWPGPHTWLVPAKQDLSPLIKGSNDRVALRLSDHMAVCDLCKKPYTGCTVDPLHVRIMGTGVKEILRKADANEDLDSDQQ